MAGDRHLAWLLGMFKLAMASTLSNQQPAVVFDQSNNVANLHPSPESCVTSIPILSAAA
jgi:hypothetical protein